MEDSFQNVTAPYSTRPRRTIPKFVVLIIGVLIVVAILFGVTRLFSGSSEPEPTPTPTLVATETPTPTPEDEEVGEEEEEPTEEPTTAPTEKPSANPVDSKTGLDRSELSIRVLNGSGEAGAAGEAAEILRNLGYVVSSTGNADNFDYENVSIEVKSESSDFLSLLKSDLSGTYTIDGTSSTLSDSSYDAVIIIGK